MTEKITALEISHARLDERVSDLEDWRKKVNGKLDRIDNKLNGLGWAVAATLGGVVAQLAILLLRR